MHICNTHLATVVFFRHDSQCCRSTEKLFCLLPSHPRSHLQTNQTYPFFFISIPYRRSLVLVLFFEASHNHIWAPLSPGSSGCTFLQNSVADSREGKSGLLTEAARQWQTDPTSCEPDYLQTRDLPLSLSHSNLLCAFTLKQSNLYFR